MSMKDAVGNGNAAMKEAAVAGCGSGDSAELRSSARRTERPGTRREPCMLNDRSSAKVGLEPEGIGTDPDVRAVLAEHRHGSGNVCGGGGSPARVEGWITYRLHCQQRTATEGCHDLEPILSNPESTDDTHKSRSVHKFFLLSDRVW